MEKVLSVRQVEHIVKWLSQKEYLAATGDNKGKNYFKQTNNLDNDLELLAHALSKSFNTQITIEDYSLGGKIIFYYKDHEQLNLIVLKLD